MLPHENHIILGDEMNYRNIVALIAILSLFAFFLVPSGLVAEKSYQPDKALCAKMIAAGKESYSRGRYLDAKNYFRKAVEADPGSQKAWHYYDQAVIFALAEKVEKQRDLLVPDVSIRSEAGTAGSHSAPDVAPIVPEVQETEPAVRFEQEGC